MADVTKLVANRQTSARAVGQALEVQAAAEAPALAKLLFPNGVPGQLTLEAFIAALASTLGARSDAMGASDRALAEELGDDQQHRDARDDARGAVRARLIGFQGAITAAYGSGALHAYSLDAVFPTNDDLLLQRARTVRTALEKGAPAQPSAPGMTLDFAALATSLATELSALDQALGDVKREEKEAEAALSKRDAAVADFEPAYAGIAGIASGLLELAGHPELADRVKPTARRRAGLDAAEATPAEATPAGLGPAPVGGPAAPSK